MRSFVRSFSLLFLLCSPLLVSREERGAKPASLSSVFLYALSVGRSVVRAICRSVCGVANQSVSQSVAKPTAAITSSSETVRSQPGEKEEEEMLADQKLGPDVCLC